MSQVMQDLRYGLRMLLKNPAFTAVAVVILALGSGANTAIFSVLNAVVLRPLPYSNPERLYEIGGMTSRGSQWFSAPDLDTWRERTEVFEKMAAARSSNMILSGVDEPEQLFGLEVGRECLPMLGVSPLLGRWFSDQDFGPAAQRLVIIGHRLWYRRFRGDPNILGKLITLNGNGYSLIGIMPPIFEFSHSRCEFWIPPSLESLEAGQKRDRPAFMVYARTKPGISPQQAQAETETVSRLLTQQFPESHKGWRATVRPLQEKTVAEARPTLLLLFGVVGFVLLIACLNVANLLLARGTDRAKEIAIRTALGAGRFRIVRQLLTENLTLAILGGALGLLLAGWANKALVALFSQKTTLPRLEQTSIDGRVLAFTLLLAFASSILFGLIPALQASKLDLNETLKETGRSGMGGIRSRRLRSLLVVAETALSLVLLAGAGLMLQSFYHLLQVNPGFKTDHVLTARLPMPAFRVPDKKRQPAYYTELLQQIQTLPGVHSAGLVTVLPLGGGEATFAIQVIHDDGTEENHSYPFRAVSPDYFRAMGIPLVMGRAFTESDTADAPPVAIVSEVLARQLWPRENPIGKQLRLKTWVPVVGVVGNIKHTGLSAATQGELYLPYLQFLGTPNTVLVMRTHSDPMDMAGAIRKRIREAQPDQPLSDVRTMEQVLADSIAQPRLYTWLLGIFAGLALILASAGVYGVMSYSVSQRQHEIGIRMALGAQNRDILREFVGQGARYVLIGLLVGLAGALAATRLLSSMLFEVKRTDPVTYALVSLLLLVWALGAIYIPARRATRVDPLTALRYE